MKDNNGIKEVVDAVHYFEKNNKFPQTHQDFFMDYNAKVIKMLSEQKYD